MKLYTVTLSHSSGAVTITTNASNEKEAMQKVCDWEKAPLSAVTMWQEASPEMARKWSDTLGIR